MILDFWHYRLYGEVIEYQSLPMGCAEYFKRKETQLVDFLLQKASKNKLTPKDKKTLEAILNRCKNGTKTQT